MALIRNGSLVNSSTNRYFGALGSYALRGALDVAHRNFAAGWASIADVTGKAGMPNGYRHPAAWFLGQKGGAISSRNEAAVSIAATAVGALGRNMVGTSTITFDIPPVLGGLIAGAVGSASIIISAVGSITATIGSPGMATISISASATPGAEGWLIGAGTVSIGGTLVSYARGHMQGTTEEAGLTPTGIANAVWNKIIDAGYTADEILKLLAAHAAGDADGLEGATTTFESLDGSKTRITGSVAAGTRTITARDVT
jgi:hypothetical protein